MDQEDRQEPTLSGRQPAGKSSADERGRNPARKVLPAWVAFLQRYGMSSNAARWLAIGFAVVMLGIFVAGASALFLFYHFSRGLPDYHQLATYNPPVMTRVYAGDGRLIQEYAVEGRVFVPISAIPKRISNAFIASEDQRFYSHPGIDVVGLTRAVFEAIGEKLIGSHRRLKGASTITQQVAQNFLLGKEYSLGRKAREAILSLRMERTFTKDHILELYLNQQYLGFGAYGVAAAAMNYFNKPLDELTVGEAAFLAGLAKAPNNYNPVRHPEAARDRRDYVIGRMLEDGYITAAEAKEARAEPITVRDRDETETVADADYYVEQIRRELAAKYGEDLLYKGGLAVRTTLNPDYEKYANKALRDGLIAYDRRHGWRGPLAKLTGDDVQARFQQMQPVAGLIDDWQMALVDAVQPDKAEIQLHDGTKGVIPLADLRWARETLPEQRVGGAVTKVEQVLHKGDVIAVAAVKDQHGVYSLRQIPNVDGAVVAMDPHTGRVLALAGGFSYQRSQYNRATQAMRQPGSAFKPFVYLAAMENGYTPSTLVLDAPFVMDQGPGQPKWKPKNYEEGEYQGLVTLRMGLEHSLNLITVRIAQAIGMDKVAEVAEKFGVVDKLPTNLANSLGAQETTVLRFTAAYAELVNGGKKVTPVMIDRIQDRNGKTIFRSDTRPCDGCTSDAWDNKGPPQLPDTREQLADPASIYQVVHMMEGVIERGTGVAVRVVGKPIAGKTGTSSDVNDTWFMGFTPDLVAGVFVGFDERGTLGEREQGATVAAPIFRDFMLAALKDKPATPFRVPPGISLVRVAHDSGKLAQPGDSNVILEAFKTGTSPETQATIMGQSAPDDEVAPGTPKQPTAGGLY
jgi:penicillin-binding protein 1A